MALQRQYVIEETALSLYMTEMRGFNVEVYRRGMGFVDDCYRERLAELMALVGQVEARPPVHFHRGVARRRVPLLATGRCRS